MRELSQRMNEFFLRRSPNETSHKQRYDTPIPEGTVTEHYSTEEEKDIDIKEFSLVEKHPYD